MNTIQLTPGVQLVAAALLRVQQYNIVLWSTAAGLNFGGLNFSAVLISASFYRFVSIIFVIFFDTKSHFAV